MLWLDTDDLNKKVPDFPWKAFDWTDGAILTGGFDTQQILSLA